MHRIKPVKHIFKLLFSPFSIIKPDGYCCQGTNSIVQIQCFQAAKDCRWELQDAAAPLFEVLDGALPIFRRQAAEGSINGDARLAITESVKLLNDMFGVDGAKAAMAEAGVTIVDDLG